MMTGDHLEDLDDAYHCDASQTPRLALDQMPLSSNHLGRELHVFVAGMIILVISSFGFIFYPVKVASIK